MIKEEVIIGCAFSNNDLAPFLKSLEEIKYKGDVILFVSEASQPYKGKLSYNLLLIDPEKEFHRYKVVHTFLAKVFTKLKMFNWWKSLHQNSSLKQLEEKAVISKWNLSFFYTHYFIIITRFLLYSYYLNKYQYKKVFLSDVFDVYFQAQPFGIVKNDEVCVFAETKSVKIGEEECNRTWVQQAFGEDVAKALFDKIIFCSGTILGPAKSINEFLNDFTRIFIKNDISPAYTHGMDQAILNYMVSYQKSNYFNELENGDFIYTVGTTPPGEIVINEDGISAFNFPLLPAVIHQYNRHQNLINHIQDKLSLS